MTSLNLWVMNKIVRPRAFNSGDDAEQFLDLGRRQHGGRLVEDENAGVEGERLEDFDALPLTNRQGRNPRIGIKIEMVARDQFRRLSPHRFAVGHESQSPRLAIEIEILRDRHRRNQFEVLMHHPDPGRAGRDRVHKGGRRSVQKNIASVRSHDAGKNVHERAFSGAILTADHVDFALLDLEIDVIQGDLVAEFLDKAAQAQHRSDRSFGHGASS